MFKKRIYSVQKNISYIKKCSKREFTHILCLHSYFNIENSLSYNYICWVYIHIFIVQKENLFCSKKHILYHESIFQCSKRELNLLQIHVCCVSIHILMLKKIIHSVPIAYIFFDPYFNVQRREFTHNLCFNPYLNVRKENLLFQSCIRCCTDEKER